jgi:hypothetical protein
VVGLRRFVSWCVVWQSGLGSVIIAHSSRFDGRKLKQMDATCRVSALWRYARIGIRTRTQ